MATIGGNIKSIREKAGMTQEQLAESIGINRVTLAKYEANRSTPGAKILSRIALALHISQDVLTGIDDDMTERDREIWELREQVRRDPERHYLFSLARNADIEDVRQAVAIIDALKSARRE